MSPKVFAPSLRATSKAKRTASESSDKTEEVKRTEQNKLCVDPRSQRVPEVPETVVPEPIVESGPVELEAAEEEEAAQEQCRAWVKMTQLFNRPYFRTSCDAERSAGLIPKHANNETKYALLVRDGN